MYAENSGIAQRKGFTLIELLITIAIIGVLALAGTDGYLASITRSRDAKRKSDLSQTARAIELYYNDFGKYPDDTGTGNMKGCGANATEDCTWGLPFKNDTNGTVYMITLPKDPVGSQNYSYKSVNSGKAYIILALLERKADPDVVDANGAQHQYGSPGDCGGATVPNSGPGVSVGSYCNYGIASSNTTVQ